ncbi:MAG: hypothetical protein KAV41_00820 [Candidatus Pacebacteria bacterium]|nr:hypothetical protein [Candidatus Paceibacterota bacterium]
MKKVKFDVGKIIWTSVAVAIVFFVLVISVIDDGQYTLRQAEAGSEHNVSGYAWSDNIGWISFNCLDAGTCGTANYGVNIAINGNMSGYAWSDNIGWISFNESDLSGCPIPNDDECKAKLTGSHLSGWAKALAGEEAADGWDGWISLGKQTGETIDYGVDLVGDNFEGYAWGDEVVGWIQFNPAYGGVVCEEGTVVIDSFYVNNIQTGFNPSATWTTTDANKCKGDWTTGNICSSVADCASVVNFEIDQPMPAGGMTYTLTCYGLGGTASESVSPAAYFELTGNPAEMDAVFTGGGATTTPINISVVSMNGFNNNVTLSADLGSLPSGSAAIFSDTVLAFSEYGAGSELKIYIPEPISGSYDIEISGNGQDVIMILDIVINATGIAPVFEEI